MYKAEYLGADVAVKKIEMAKVSDPMVLLFLKREIALLKSARHPNIVTFLGHAIVNRGQPNEEVLLVMEYLSRGDLRSYLLSHKNELTWLNKVSFAFDIACAMAYLHSRKIIFRDLKPKNLLLDDNYRVKLIDFGLARTHDAQARPRTLCGTDDFMAPEVMLGLPYTEKADVFSFGLVLLEIITCRKLVKEMPRTPLDAFGINEQKIRTSGVIPSDCPSYFSELAFFCCKYEEQRRPSFKQVLEFLKKLKAVISNLTDGRLKTPALKQPNTIHTNKKSDSSTNKNNTNENNTYTNNINSSVDSDNNTENALHRKENNNDPVIVVLAKRQPPNFVPPEKKENGQWKAMWKTERLYFVVILCFYKETSRCC